MPACRSFLRAWGPGRGCRPARSGPVPAAPKRAYEPAYLADVRRAARRRLAAASAVPRARCSPCVRAAARRCRPGARHRLLRGRCGARCRCCLPTAHLWRASGRPCRPAPYGRPGGRAKGLATVSPVTATTSFSPVDSRSQSRTSFSLAVSRARSICGTPDSAAARSPPVPGRAGAEAPGHGSGSVSSQGARAGVPSGPSRRGALRFGMSPRAACRTSRGRSKIGRLGRDGCVGGLPVLLLALHASLQQCSHGAVADTRLQAAEQRPT